MLGRLLRTVLLRTLPARDENAAWWGKLEQSFGTVVRKPHCEENKIEGALGISE